MRARPLHRYIAAHEGNAEVVELLLRAKAQVDHANDSGITPLYIAVQKSHADVSRLLLAAGADPNAATSSGSVPITMAVFHCDLPIVRQLLGAGALIDVALGKERNSVALRAAAALDVDVLCELVLHGANLNW